MEALTHPNLDCPSRGLEFVLLDESVAATPSREAGFEMHLNTGPAMDFSLSFDPSSEPSHWFVIDRSFARTDAIRLTGPSPDAMFAEIPRRWVLESLLEMLAWHRANESNLANIVLNACRAWRFTQHGVWSSKVDGAEWAKSQVGIHPQPIHAAVTLRRGITTARIQRAEVDHLVRRVEETIAEVLVTARQP